MNKEFLKEYLERTGKTLSTQPKTSSEERERQYEESMNPKPQRKSSKEKPKQ